MFTMDTSKSKYTLASQKDGDVSNGDVELNCTSNHLANNGNYKEKEALTSVSKSKETSIGYKKQSHKICKRRTCLEKYLMLMCLLLFLACMIVTCIAIYSARNQKEEPNVCLTEHCIKTAAQLLNTMDKTVDPCDDFFQYACGSWNNKHIIPEDKSTYDIFEELHGQLEITIKRLLEEPVTDYDVPATIKAKVLYQSCTNKTIIEQVADEPLQKILQELHGWPVIKPSWNRDSFIGLEKMMGVIRGHHSAAAIVRMLVATDDKDSSSRVIQLDQPNLGMPSREYYLDPSEKKYKDAYLTYMIEMAKLLGADEETAIEDMTNALEFETQLAEIVRPQNERHDTGALYRKLTIAELNAAVPEFDWLLYFNSFMPSPITEDEKVVCFAVDYMQDMGKLVNDTDSRVLANYLLWSLILGLAPELSKEFQEVRHNYRKVLQGVSQDTPRWQKCVVLANERMGMAVGRMFVREHFDEESKETALEMIENIKDAFLEILQNNDWMDDETKAVAKEKAYHMNERIGYPEFILDDDELEATYSGLKFDPDTYFENVLRLERHDSLENLKKLRKPVIKDKWEQAPAVFNAFYNPNTNDIVFPAGILQPLFYDKNSPKSLNYGGIGVVIGHEITHGFDDKGRQYDKDGNLRQWWNNKTISAFRERAQCVIDQYSNEKLEPFGFFIDGKNTQGENIADNGGLKESFKAYQKWVKDNGEEPTLPGIDLNNNQLFFLNYAQIWCGIMRPEEALRNVRTDVHSPGPIRVKVPLSNSEDFAEAYSCPKKSNMNPENKCSVW